MTTTTPREVFQRMQQQWLGSTGELTGDDLADDVVVETPFAPAGSPTRIAGKREWVAFANRQRAALPVRFDECRILAIHDTTDPSTIIVEYELTGTATKNNRQSTVAFIGVLKVRDGKVALWREYQNTMAIQQALS